MNDTNTWLADAKSRARRILTSKSRQPGDCEQLAASTLKVITKLEVMEEEFASFQNQLNDIAKFTNIKTDIYREHKTQQ